jgi:hypothetical protein
MPRKKTPVIWPGIDPGTFWLVAQYQFSLYYSELHQETHDWVTWTIQNQKCYSIPRYMLPVTIMWQWSFGPLCFKIIHGVTNLWFCQFRISFGYTTKFALNGRVLLRRPRLYQSCSAIEEEEWLPIHLPITSSSTYETKQITASFSITQVIFETLKHKLNADLKIWVPTHGIHDGRQAV